MRKENVTIYNESERLDLENADITLKMQAVTVPLTADTLIA